jgi:hypothetical protein
VANTQTSCSRDFVLNLSQETVVTENFFFFFFFCSAWASVEIVP